MLSTALDYLDVKHVCPHCNRQLSLCHAPPMHVGDGLGWGAEYLFICLNNDCPLFVKGWDYIESQYGHLGSYRYMRLPDSNESYNMMVGSTDAFTGTVVDPEQVKSQSSRYRKEKDAVAQLDTCVQEKNLEPLLFLLLDDFADLEYRKRAAELLVALNEINCIEPLRNHSFRDSHLEQAVNMAIKAILDAHYLQECPYCAELIKVRAKVCKHCQKDLP